MPICEAFYNSKQVAICKKKETVCSMCPQLAWRHPMTFLWSAASLDSRTACIMGKLRGLWTPAHFQMSQPASLWPRMMLWLVFSPFNPPMWSSKYLLQISRNRLLVQPACCKTLQVFGWEDVFAVMKHLSLAEMPTIDGCMYHYFSKDLFSSLCMLKQNILH